MNKAVTRQIQRIKSSNESLLEKMRTLLLDADSIIAAGKWQSLVIHHVLRMIFIYNKKAIDASVSLNVIYKDRVYDNYEEGAINFFKNASCVSDTMPSTATALTAFSFSIQYKNKGIFYAWNSAKAIRLRIRVYKTDGTPQLYDPIVVLLDTAITQNTPGDELTNGDFGKIKIFNVVSDADYIAGQYLFTTSIIDSETDVSDYDTYFVNSLYSKTITIT